MGADQSANTGRAVLVFDLVQAFDHVVQCGLPIHFLPLAPLLDHGAGQALFTVQGFVGEAIAVGNPAFVDRLVFHGHHTHDFVVFHLNNQVGTG